MQSYPAKIIVKADNSRIDESGFLSAARQRRYDWHTHQAEGQLAVDIAQTDKELIVAAPMAGTAPEKIGLHLHNDLLTIRGERINPIPAGADSTHEENYWGRFSRTIVLPCEVNYELAKAEYQNGLLVVRLPKKNTNQEIKIMIIDE